MSLNGPRERFVVEMLVIIWTLLYHLVRTGFDPRRGEQKRPLIIFTRLALPDARGPLLLMFVNFCRQEVINARSRATGI